ncbi:MAG: hypothetical protein JOZ72_14455 [Alphaproteobacteria bacterium]|nr:hypothetical protein [Alphaproteobacteria bacterium]
MRAILPGTMVLALLCGTASAQREGRYAGSLSDGTMLAFTIDRNPSNDKLRVATATLSFQTPCASLGTGGDFAGQWSWTPNVDLGAQHTTVRLNNTSTFINFYMKAHLGRFSGPFQFANSVLVPMAGGYRATVCGRRQWQHLDTRYVGPGGGGGEADAAQVGSYDGASADGKVMYLTVANDSATGHLEIAGATVASRCAVPSWSWSPDVEIAGNKTGVAFFNGYAAVKFQVRFPDAGTAAGGIVVRSAVGQLRGGAPNKARLCLAPWQSFSLSRTGPTGP